jgi:Na+-driven multidrug efflux pump
MLMFALFPILGITQGFIPIAGYNHGAQNIKGQGKYPNFYQICSAVSITNFVLYFTMQRLLYPFYYRSKSYCRDTGCLALVFAASPIIAIQLIELPIFRRREMLRKRCC